jgi:tRNA dimethylallyltransferase
LHRLLARLDPVAAERIAPRDTPKVVRAIEVCLLAGRPITEIHQAERQRLEGFAPLKVGLMPRRGELYQRIARRIEAMLARGWLDEVKDLLARGTSPAAKPFEFIGYRELRVHCAGELILLEAAKAIEQATRHYAKRQITWFRREPGVKWFEGFGDDPQIAGAVLRHLEGHLPAALPARAQTFEKV